LILKSDTCHLAGQSKIHPEVEFLSLHGLRPMRIADAGGDNVVDSGVSSFDFRIGRKPTVNIERQQWCETQFGCAAITDLRGRGPMGNSQATSNVGNTNSSLIEFRHDRRQGSRGQQ
jgi:hypothetical protein